MFLCPNPSNIAGGDCQVQKHKPSSGRRGTSPGWPLPSQVSWSAQVWRGGAEFHLSQPRRWVRNMVVATPGAQNTEPMQGFLAQGPKLFPPCFLGSIHIQEPNSRKAWIQKMCPTSPPSQVERVPGTYSTQLCVPGSSQT